MSGMHFRNFVSDLPGDIQFKLTYCRHAVVLRLQTNFALNTFL